MISTLTVLVVATSSYGVQGACPEVTLAIERADLALYLDPSEANRREVTTSLVKETLVPFRTLESLRRKYGGWCVLEAAAALTRMGDGAIVERALSEQVATYQRLEKEARKDPSFSSSLEGEELARALEIAHRLQRGARSLDESRRKCLASPREDRCEVDDLRRLVFAGEKVPDGLIRRYDESVEGAALIEWIGLGEMLPDRLSRLEAALASSFPDRGDALGRTARGVLRRWALDELLPGRDPRRWSPDAVAIVVRAARNADRAFVAARKEEEGARQRVYMSLLEDCQTIDSDGYWAAARGAAPPSETGIQHCRFYEIVVRLIPMGVGRTFDLIAPVGFSTPESPVGDLQHFRGEMSLYSHELGMPPPGTRETRESARARQAYFAKRWKETDEKAPSPPLEAIRKALAREPQAPAPIARVAAPATPAKPALPTFDAGPTMVDRRDCCVNGASPCSLDLRPYGFSRGEPGGTCDGDPARFAPLPERVLSSPELMNAAP